MFRQISSPRLTILPFLLFVALILPARADLSAQSAAGPERVACDDDWKFFLGDAPNTQAADFDDAAWRAVTLPHDWSIEGRIGPKEPTGGPGGFFPTGIGWYRHRFDAPTAWNGKKVSVEFEGVYMNADVFLNGQKLATQHYGYTTFFVDLTPALKTGAANVLAVRVDNSQQKNTRWYSGSGIYRHVWLHVTGPVHVAPWGVFVSTGQADARKATLAIQTRVLNETDAAQPAVVRTTITGPDGRVLIRAESRGELPAHGEQTVSSGLDLADPPLWSPANPRLCHAVTTVEIDGQPVDVTTTTFGVRALAWTPELGLTLNGQTYKLSGGCIHHDNGVLGACAFDRAEERKVERLKAAGFNAIRTAHNPPSPTLLDACDRLGMLVLDEAFDCWVKGKNPKDYSLYFKDEWTHDLDAMILRDRNHPAVIMWSVGNEINEMYEAGGPEYEPQMVERIHALDHTRPVTNGIRGWPVDPKKPAANDAEHLANAEKVWNALDIVGTNYALHQHIAQHDEHPTRMLVSTECYSPVGLPNDVLDHPYIVGDFVWTAQDYLGESGVGRSFYEGDPSEPLDPARPDDKPGTIRPVMHGNDRLFPWHGANSGDLDLLGNTKPAAHLRNIRWNMGEKLAVAVREPTDGKKLITVGWGWHPTWESWTWPGEEGKSVEVEVYSRYDKVRLYLNDELIGEMPTTRAQNYTANLQVPYAPGTLRAVGLEGGREVGDVRLVTAGAPAAIRLTPDRAVLHADGQDLSFVAVEVVDKDGRLQPNADAEISFDLSGPGTIAGLGSALLEGEEPYQGSRCHVYHGRALVVVRVKREAGKITLDARADSLADASAVMQASATPTQ